jgi:mannan polymerase II complex MNN10 subunit
MNIAVISIQTPEIYSYSKYTSVINKSYCDKYGYKYIQYNYSLDDSRPIPWSKIIAIQNHIKDFDWIYWIDADAVFFNHDIKIEDHINEQYNLIISKACSEEWANTYYKEDAEFLNINTGSFLLKGKDIWSIMLLKKIYEQTNRINHHWWENQALIDIYLQNNPEINLKIHILEQYVLNGFENRFYCYKYFAEQYILHWAGMSIQDRNYFATIRYDEFLQGLFTGNKKQNRFCIE